MSALVNVDFPQSWICQIEQEKLSLDQVWQPWVNWLAQQPETEIENAFDRLLETLETHPAAQKKLGAQLHQWLTDAYAFPAFVGLGLFSRQGFLTEFTQRFYEHLNPAPCNDQLATDQLKKIFGSIQHTDWVLNISAARWVRLFYGLSAGLDESLLEKTRLTIYQQVLYALEMLSVWVAAEELEPALVRLDPRLIAMDSAFIAQQRELGLFVRDYQAYLQDPQQPLPDADHLRVLLEQCREQVERLQRRGSGAGISVAVNHLLERLDQTLARIEDFLDILTSQRVQNRALAAARLFSKMVQASVEQRSIRSLWQRSVRLLSRSITQSKSDHGEHYLVRTSSEYLAMLRSAAGAGVIIALMAWMKITVESLGLNPLPQALLVSLNYGLGFVLVHLLHFTIATKQPAMTAATFAQAVERGEGGRAVKRRLATLLIDVNRSQMAAVLGNVSVAMTLAASIAWTFYWVFGQTFLSAAEVEYHLQAVHPVLSLALVYAAIAGVWLFCSGLIAGYFDNRAAFLQLDQRLTHHPWLSRLSPQARTRIARYLHDNYGALAGNFLFGCLLGMTGYLGYLLGLPLDIRHVAFSSANLGYAAVSGGLGGLQILLFLIFVLLIGLVNLWVSFSLALIVALRARATRIDSLPGLLKQVVSQIARNPRALFLPLPSDVANTADKHADR